MFSENSNVICTLAVDLFALMLYQTSASGTSDTFIAIRSEMNGILVAMSVPVTSRQS